MENVKKQTAGAASSVLVSQGKSSRLQAMRDKTMAAELAAPSAGLHQNKAVDSSLSPALLLARQLIDQRLAEILASLPAGKQQRLFKIRFGVELGQIKDLPIKRIVVVLKISHTRLNDLAANMKQIGDLNYNGGQPN